jgi:hypothetical protein
MPANPLPALPFVGPGIPGGYRVGSKSPIDVRSVYHTTAQRNSETQTYPGMPVVVLGSVVMAGAVPTYPNAKLYVLTVDREPNYGGPTTFDQDWQLVTGGGAAAANAYKGPFGVYVNDNEDGVDLSPDLKDPALRATLRAGDFYKVSFATTQFAFDIDGITELAVNDTLFWSGVKFDRFENTNPEAEKPLYKDTEGSKFLTDVEQIIRNINVREYQPGVDYKRGDVMYYADNDGTSTFLALRDLGAAEAAVFTGQAAIGRWLMLSTTNPDFMPGMPVSGDHIGRKATGSFTPSTRSNQTYLTPEEVDARIRQYGGGGYKPLLGGKARTFATADVNEQPAN